MKLKSILCNLVLLLLAPFGMSQCVSVQFVVQDANGQTFNNGTYTWQFQANYAVPGPYLFQGANFTQNVAGTLASDGSATSCLTPNTGGTFSTLGITPSGSTWQLTACPNASVACSTFQYYLPDNTTNTVTFTAPAINVPPLVASPRAYADSEVTPQGIGSSYFNTTTNTTRTWNGSAFVNPGPPINLASPGPIGATTPAAATFTTVTAVATVSGSAFTAIPPGANCIFEGDSITAGFGLSAGQDWPSQAMALPQFANCTKYNFAVAGDQVADLQARYTTSVQPLKPATTGKPAFLFVWVGTNNLGTRAMTAASTLTALQTYWSGAIADGFTVVAATITPRGTSAGVFALGATQETQRYILNSSIRGLVGLAYSYLLDFDRTLQDSTDTNMFQDGLHPAATGARILAQAAAATVAGRSGINAVANPAANPVPTTPTYANAVNLTSGSDLNTVVGCGVYDINGVVNGPPGFSSTPDSGNSWMHLQVLCQSTAANGGSGYAAQFASNLIGTAQTVWYRTEAGGVWNPWVSLIPSSSFLAASTDLNTVTTCGTYDGQYLTNGPLGSNWIHLLVLCNDSSLSNYTSQIATNLIGTTQTMWLRTQNGGASTWNGWIQVYPGTSGILSATSPSIGGSALSVGCTNQSTVTVSGAVTSMACVMTGVVSNPTNIQPQCVVTSANTVTPQLCTAVASTPGAQTYAIRVIP